MKTIGAATAIAVLALVRSTFARGLNQGLRGEAHKAKDDSIDDLKAENEELKMRNNHLEAMMKMARAEVHRLDVAAKAQRKQGVNGEGVGRVEVLNQEMEDLRKKLQGEQADKKELVRTLRQMLARNSTKLFRQQAEKAQQMKFALELKCGQDRQVLETQVKAAQSQVQEANAKCEDTKEMAQTLQDQNMELQKSLQKLQMEYKKSLQTQKDLAADKANLVTTMHALMRDTTQAKQDLQTEKATEKKEAKEIAADEAKLAKLQPKPKKKKLKSPARSSKSVTGKLPAHKHHEESMAAQMAHLQAINHYIIRSAEANAEEIDDSLEAQQDKSQRPEVTLPVDVEQPKEENSEVQPVESPTVAAHEEAKPEAANSQGEKKVVDDSAAATPEDVEIMKKDPQGAGLQEWLGLKLATSKEDAGTVPKDANGLSPIDALDPDAVKQEKKKVETKKKQEADDGGDEIESLLSQAKQQLKEMDA
jgi:myosin heavy subunit